MMYHAENDLSAQDGKCVRVRLTTGEVLEGACQHNSAEYNEIEFGESEEGLEIVDRLIYKSQIEDIEVIEDEDAFLQTFGVIEEEAVADGFDTVKNILYSDEPRSSIRLLQCLSARWNTLPYRDRMAAFLPELLRYTDDARVRSRTQKLMEETDHAQ